MAKNKDLTDKDIDNLVENARLHAEVLGLLGNEVADKKEFMIEKSLAFALKGSREEIKQLPRLIERKRNVIAGIDRKRSR